MTAAAISRRGMRVSKADVAPPMAAPDQHAEQHERIDPAGDRRGGGDAGGAHRGNSVSATETLTATEMAAKYIGVRVSSRAK